MEQSSSHGHDFLMADLLLTLPVGVYSADPSKVIVLEPEPHRVEVRCQGVSVLKKSCPVLWAQKTGSQHVEKDCVGTCLLCEGVVYVWSSKSLSVQLRWRGETGLPGGCRWGAT